jgi:C_GCAxxG_C_C family probable redox protein
MDYQTAVKVSAGFGGGMMLGSTCGAVTGGIMAIGLKQGGVGADALRTPKLVKQFAARFTAMHKSVNCTDLIGVDLSTFDVGSPEALNESYKAAMAKAAFKNCSDFVRDATTIVTEMLADAPR